MTKITKLFYTKSGSIIEVDITDGMPHLNPDGTVEQTNLEHKFDDTPMLYIVGHEPMPLPTITPVQRKPFGLGIDCFNTHAPITHENIEALS